MFSFTNRHGTVTVKLNLFSRTVSHGFFFVPRLQFIVIKNLLGQTVFRFIRVAAIGCPTKNNKTLIVGLRHLARKFAH